MSTYNITYGKKLLIDYSQRILEHYVTEGKTIKEVQRQEKQGKQITKVYNSLVVLKKIVCQEFERKP